MTEMLRGLVVFTMQGRWQSAIVIAVMSLMALMLPPVSYLASGIVALCTLRAGPKEGITVLLIATIMFALAAMMLMSQPLLAGIFLISNWLPVYGISLILGYTRSLSMNFISDNSNGCFAGDWGLYSFTKSSRMVVTNDGADGGNARGTAWLEIRSG